MDLGYRFRGYRIRLARRLVPAGVRVMRPPSPAAPTCGLCGTRPASPAPAAPVASPPPAPPVSLDELRRAIREELLADRELADCVTAGIFGDALARGLVALEEWPRVRATFRHDPLGAHRHLLPDDPPEPRADDAAAVAEAAERWRRSRRSPDPE
jgi:hypothetical protein